MTDGALERDALAKLLRNEDAAAWAALKDDGWLDLVPEEDGTWPMVTTAATVAGVVASAGRYPGDRPRRELCTRCRPDADVRPGRCAPDLDGSGRRRPDR